MRRVLAKMHGAGNDFVVVDAAPPDDVDAIVRAVCDRRRGIGADGALFMERLDADPAFRMHFFNCDGSRSGLCLNGARCVALRAVELGWAQDDFGFVTDHEEIRALVHRSDDRTANVTLRWRGAVGEPDRVSLPLGSVESEGWWIDIGDPHLVVELEQRQDLERDSFEDLARPLRHWSAPSKTGSNVHFVHRDGDRWAIRSFERGIEGETLACGSGCVSAVRALGASGRTISLETRSGDVLEISPSSEGWTLGGPAVQAFLTEWDLDA